MKKKMLILIAVFIAALALNDNQVFAQSKNDQKIALQEANDASSIINIDPSISLDQYAYLIGGNKIGYVSQIDGQHVPDYFLISPGIHFFSVIYYTTIDLKAVFEAGKYYTFDCTLSEKFLKQSRATVSIIEVTDKDMLERAEKKVVSMRNYLDWTQAHSGILDGTYQTKDGKNQITFEGNTFHFSNPNSKKMYDGTFWFNGETMILRFDSLGKNKAAMGILYYQINNDVLNIIANDGTFFEAFFNPRFKGQYFKNPK